jgi:hypothetical protein
MKPLKFIHITKTAGTSIEDEAFNCGIHWGRYHGEYGPWHGFFPNKNIKLKNTYDWFTVVRNPYDRIVSEYHCYWGGIGNSDIKHTKEQFNKFIMNKIKNRVGYGDHYSEQYKYIDTVNDNTIHILHYENLKEEFVNLMKRYNLPPRLNMYKNVSNVNKKFTIDDLSKECIELINTVYKKDFELFDYEMK